MEDIKKPNFFIIGAPKCGTTALSEYLREYPDIFIPRGENWVEMNYFNSDINIGKRRSLGEDINGYLSYFKEAPDDSLVGEKSVWYFYSKEAVSNILKFNSEAKFIVMIRNPIEMVQSLHAQLLKDDDDNIKSFEKAWRLQEERKKGKSIPDDCKDSDILQYGKRCSLGEQLERLYQQVPQERVLVIFLDDFKKDTKREYKRALEFLGLPDDGREEFPVINRRKKVQSVLLREAVKKTASVKEKVGIKKSLGVLKTVKEKNIKPDKKPPVLSEEMRSELVSYFKEDVAKLSKLTGRDLSYWLE